MNRRDLLKAGALAAACAVPAVRPALAGAAPAIGAARAFSVPLPIPRVLHPSAITSEGAIYQMTMAETAVEVLPGRMTRVRTFNGRFPGPTIVARRGRPVIIRQTNKLHVPTAVHLHGGHVAPGDDGYPTDTIEPGGSRDYRYPNEQRAASLWYHDHAHHHEAENVFRGLAGSYLLTDEHEESLPLPKDEFDVPLLFRGGRFDAEGNLVYGSDHVKGPDNGTVLVNGRPRPYFRVAARKYRFRMANMANQRPFELRLRDSSGMIQIGSDNGLLPEPVCVDSVTLWPAERADVIIDFSRYRPGTRLVLENAAPPWNEPPEVLRFDVTCDAEDDSLIPDRLASIEDFGRPVAEREFRLSSDPKNHQFLINGKEFDPNRVDIRPGRGDTELWTIFNADERVPHTFHTHLEPFRVIDRDGRGPRGPESGLKDTIVVRPREMVRILLRFHRYTGRYVYHCHQLEHNSMGMMGQMEIRG
ncbi:multicopper oxidase family protein [Amycolatopsis sp. EV170708-02-1]|uniref:multicopper oxidase family protein n=1 Tax=Amycolatopsis sp. EV170708-02-1 TaxID=2919322 RepID=UPI001F0CC913|nr:multicopper oxidase family protein [Amycolatopsis sp. EV170708-02-1]UMP06794.1 multicopper oxidase family protein [Amycolatopsis sp. EV170708-02-1]